jgi:hypothetical protein
MGAHKAGPRRANDRPHGQEVLAPMRIQAYRRIRRSRSSEATAIYLSAMTAFILAEGVVAFILATVLGGGH